MIIEEDVNVNDKPKMTLEDMSSILTLAMNTGLPMSALLKSADILRLGTFESYAEDFLDDH